MTHDFFYSVSQSRSGFMCTLPLRSHTTVPSRRSSLQFTCMEVLFSLVLDLPARSTSVEDKDPEEVCVGVRNLIMIMFLFTSFNLQKSHRSLPSSTWDIKNMWIYDVLKTLPTISPREAKISLFQRAVKRSDIKSDRSRSFVTDNS